MSLLLPYGNIPSASSILCELLCSGAYRRALVILRRGAACSSGHEVAADVNRHPCVACYTHHSLPWLKLYRAIEINKVLSTYVHMFSYRFILCYAENIQLMLLESRSRVGIGKYINGLGPVVKIRKERRAGACYSPGRVTGTGVTEHSCHSYSVSPSSLGSICCKFVKVDDSFVTVIKGLVTWSDFCRQFVYMQLCFIAISETGT